MTPETNLGQWGRRLLVTGIGATLVEIAALVVLSLLRPAWGAAAFAGAAAEIAAGRETGIAVALGTGLPWWLTWPLMTWQDLTAVCLTFPFFLWALHRFHDADNVVMRRLRAWETAAEHHQRWVHRWGPAGLVAFLVAPFLVNGPLVAAIVGRLGGIHTRGLVVPVAVGVVAGTGLWVLGFDAVLAATSRIHPWAGPIATMGVAALFLLAGVIADRFGRSTSKTLR